MTTLRVCYVDTFVVRRGASGLEILALRRGPGGRNPGTWESVHGTIEPGENPVQAALREVREETDLETIALYNLSRVEGFYRHATDEVALIPAFAAFVAPESVATLSGEHDRAEWLAPAQAAARLTWPRERRALDDLLSIVGVGGAGEGRGEGGLLDDVLRVC
ncbi:MAG TPA: NUDIX domain-containing protein [Gemmatimonadales bacterium]|nr:NUDIX domain-containing protein [Gemmatimonadales bacterium]